MSFLLLHPEAVGRNKSLGLCFKFQQMNLYDIMYFFLGMKSPSKTFITKKKNVLT